MSYIRTPPIRPRSGARFPLGTIVGNLEEAMKRSQEISEAERKAEADSGGMEILPVPAPGAGETVIREELDDGAQDGMEAEEDPDGEAGAGQRADEYLDEEMDDDEDDEDDEPIYETLPVPSPGGGRGLPTEPIMDQHEPRNGGGGGMEIMPVPTPGAPAPADDGTVQIGQFAVPKWSLYAGGAVAGGLLLWALLSR